MPSYRRTRLEREKEKEKEKEEKEKEEDDSSMSAAARARRARRLREKRRGGVSSLHITYLPALCQVAAATENEKMYRGKVNRCMANRTDDSYFKVGISLTCTPAVTIIV